MFITRINDERCCTCNHWQGVRVTENDGYIYSLKDVEGICHGLQPPLEGRESCMSLTFPSYSCQNWLKWNGLALQETVASDNDVQRAAAAGAF